MVVSDTVFEQPTFYDVCNVFEKQCSVGFDCIALLMSIFFKNNIFFNCVFR